jgi:hypothetical protein
MRTDSHASAKKAAKIERSYSRADQAARCKVNLYMNAKVYIGKIITLKHFL